MGAIVQDQQVMQTPRLELAGALGVGGIFGGVGAALLCLVLDGSGRDALASGLVVILSVLGTLWPVLLIARVRAQRLAALLLGVSVSRLLLLLGSGLVVDLLLAPAREAYWLGILGGGLAILIIETTTLLVVARGIGQRGVTHG